MAYVNTLKMFVRVYELGSMSESFNDAIRVLVKMIKAPL